MNNKNITRTLVTTTAIGLLTHGVLAQEGEDIVPDFDPTYGFVTEADNDWMSPDRFGVGVFGGTTGIGALIQYDVTDWFYLQGKVGGFGFGREFELDGVDYDADLSLFSGGVTANFLPFYKNTSIFRGTIGLFGVNNTIDLDASAEGESFDIGNATLTLGSGDRLEGEVSYSGLAPYVGLGLDFDFGQQKNYQLSFDLGVLFVGEPDTDLRAVGTFADAARQAINLDAEVDRESQEIRDEISQINIFPVISMSFTYQF